MILVQDIWSRVQSLSRKGKGGYSSSSEFNDNLRAAQNWLFDFHLQHYEDMLSRDSLSPLAVSSDFTAPNGFLTIPESRHVLDVGLYGYKNEDDCSDAPVKEFLAIDYVSTEEEFDRKKFRILSKLYWTMERGGIQVNPRTTRNITVKYLMNPPLAFRAVTIDPTTDTEQYDEAGSINLIWNERDFNNIVALVMYSKGVMMRDNEIIKWLAGSPSGSAINK